MTRKNGVNAQHIVAVVNNKGGVGKTTSTLLRCIGSAHGLRPVPITLEDAITMPQTLVLDKALALPRNARVPDMI